MKKIFIFYLTVAAAFFFSAGLAAADSDSTAPAAISNLALQASGSNSVVLTWTATGDDNSTGQATSYDIRYLEGAVLSEDNWNSAVSLEGESAPKISGSSETFTAERLLSGLHYYFAVKVSDEAGNISSISNVPDIWLASPDAIAPKRITNLDGTAATSSVTITWTAPGDDNDIGTATLYEMKYSTSNITASNWSSAYSVSTIQLPQAAGTAESLVVTGLTPGTGYYFIMRAMDDVSNYSELSNSLYFTTAITAPPAITDLSVGDVGQTSLKLSWTTPNFQAGGYTFSRLEARYAQAEISESNWSSAGELSGEPLPVAGSGQNLTVGQLTAGTAYYFALKLVDDHGNFSALSNAVSTTTLASSVYQYPDGSLIKKADDERIFLIEGQKKRWITSVGAFNERGLKWENVQVVTMEVMASFTQGADITATAQTSPGFAAGSLVRMAGDDKIYAIVGGKYKRHILGPPIMDCYPHLKIAAIQEVTAAQAAYYQTAALVRAANDTRVYEINGDASKHWINMTAGEFTASGRIWDMVSIINDAERDFYTSGPDVNYKS